MTEIADEIKEQTKETIKEIKKNTIKRIKLPVLYSFMIAWSIFNWDVILYTLFSNDSFNLKLKTLKMEHGIFDHFDRFLYPSISAIAFLILYNYIEWSFYRIAAHGMNLRRDEIEEATIEELASEIRIEQERSELINEKAQNQEKEELIIKIQRLESEIDIEKKINEDISSKRKLLADILDSFRKYPFFEHLPQFSIEFESRMNAIPNEDIESFMYEITNILSSGGDWADFMESAPLADSFIEQGLISRNENKEPEYQITEFGRFVFFNHLEKLI